MENLEERLKQKLDRQHLEVVRLRMENDRLHLKCRRRKRELRRVNRTIAVLYAAIGYGRKDTAKPRLVTVEINDA